MGIFKSAENKLREQAEKAAQEGRTVFVVKLSALSGLHSTPMPEWTEWIEAIEACGWTLTDWSVTATDERHFAYPVFRRTS